VEGDAMTFFDRYGSEPPEDATYSLSRLCTPREVYRDRRTIWIKAKVEMRETCAELVWEHRGKFVTDEACRAFLDEIRAMEVT
jgi:hypothetical protein